MMVNLEHLWEMKRRIRRERERDFLLVVLDYQRVFGQSPRRIEMARTFLVTSQTIGAWLKALVAKGYIKRDRGHIEITDAGREWLADDEWRT